MQTTTILWLRGVIGWALCRFRLFRSNPTTADLLCAGAVFLVAGFECYQVMVRATALSEVAFSGAIYVSLGAFLLLKPISAPRSRARSTGDWIVPTPTWPSFLEQHRARLGSWRRLGAIAAVIAGLILAVRWEDYAPVLFSTSTKTKVTSVGLAFMLGEQHHGRLVVVDVRSDDDFARRHIRGAIQLTKVPLKTDGSNSIVLYCRDAMCGAAFAHARQLSHQLQKQVFVYEGGLREWIECGMPTTEGHDS